MKKVIILGACGSIGSQTLDIIEKNRDRFEVVGVSVGRDLEKAKNVIEKFHPEFVVARSENDMNELNKESDLKFSYGDKGLVELATYKENEEILLVVALVGSVGLKPTVEAIKIKRHIALANKETLVTAGSLVMDLAKENNVTIFPIDSEHSAIYQCLVGENINNVERLIITASGGALRDYPLDKLDYVTKEEVLNHPNWSMGEKITVDCATMMNKGFEIIEAHYLFNIPYDRITPIIHRESIVHSLVEFKDSSVKAQMGVSDMRIPISYALSYPDRAIYDNKLDLVKKSISFEEVNYDRYPCLKMALDAANKGGIYPTVLNASNEAAVRLFLANKISYKEISEIIKNELENVKEEKVLTIDLILDVDRKIKDKILKKYGGEGLC